MCVRVLRSPSRPVVAFSLVALSQEKMLFGRCRARERERGVCKKCRVLQGPWHRGNPRFFCRGGAPISELGCLLESIFFCLVVLYTHEMPPGRGKGKGDWKSVGGGGRGGGGGKGSRYQRQQGKGGGRGGSGGYANNSQAARLAGGGRKESAVKAALREQGDALDKRFGCVVVVWR